MTTREKNRLPCNVEARKRYKKEHFQYQTVSFKKEEITAINTYCLENNIPKNTFFRSVCMAAIGRPIV